jgi:hypothetical protein
VSKPDPALVRTINARNVAVAERIDAVYMSAAPTPEEKVLDFEPALAVADAFVGRDAVFTALETFRSTHDRGYFDIVAEAGLGKTALAAAITRRKAGSFKHRWMESVARAGIKDLVFHDLRRTFCHVVDPMRCGLRGDPHVARRAAAWFGKVLHSQLGRAAARCGDETRGVHERGFRRESVMQVPLTATSVPPSYIEQNVSMRNVVPRDRTHTIIPGISKSLRFLTAAIGAKSDSVEMALGFV